MQLLTIKRIAVVLAAFVLALAADIVAAKPFPDPRGYVSDFAEVVDEATEQRISAICRELDEKTGAQIGVASFPDMSGDEIDGFTSRLFEQWMPGQRGVNNGILIVNAIAERRIRIEIGYGLEALIPDAVAARVRRDVMTPLLKEGKYGEAYLAGVAALARIIAEDEGVTLKSLENVRAPHVTRDEPGHNSPLIGFVFLLALVIAIILINIAVAAGQSEQDGDSWTWGGGFGGGGGGWGGGGGGGGGFGGFGGGMSGGGGSSGGY